jgi:hypothetical protein
MATSVVDLTDWVTSWAAAHNNSHDDQLGPLEGKPAWNAADRELLARWKFESNRARLKRTLNLLAGNEQNLADELTRRALTCNDDLGAWLIAQQILGFGPALASAMLMAYDRERFTVIDVRAFRSIVLVVRTGSLTGRDVDPDPLVQSARFSHARTWLAYLSACRALATVTGCSLRNVDRALYQANGQDTLPTAGSTDAAIS